MHASAPDAAETWCCVGGARTHIPIFMCLCSMNTWMVSETTRPPRIRAHRQTPVLWLRSLVNLFTVLICRTFWQFQVITVNLLVIERVYRAFCQFAHFAMRPHLANVNLFLFSKTMRIFNSFDFDRGNKANNKTKIISP